MSKLNYSAEQIEVNVNKTSTITGGGDSTSYPSTKGVVDYVTTKMDTHQDVCHTDYIVESGNQDGWTYRKWNSGFVELYKEARVTSASDYGDNVALMVEYFPFALVEAMANVSGGQFQTWGSVIRMVHTNGVYIQAFMDCVKPVSSYFCWFYISVTGRWK